MRETYAKYQNKYRLGSKMAPDCCITVNGVIVMVLMHQCVRYTGHLEQYAAFWTVCRGTSRPLTLTSTEETGHVWLLFPIFLFLRLSLTSGIKWFGILIRGSACSVLSVSVGSDYIHSDFTVRGVPSHHQQQMSLMAAVSPTMWALGGFFL